MKYLKFKISGTKQIIVHSDRGANPLDPLVKKLKSITSIRKKTDEHHEAISQIQWQLGLYHDDELGVYIPAENIEACIKKGAALSKLGTTFTRGLMIIDDKCKLEYAGTRDLKKLTAKYKDYALIRTVVISRARVVATRPLFDKWGLEFNVAFDETQLDQESIIRAVEDAGKMVGLGGWRPRYGRFNVDSVAENK